MLQALKRKLLYHELNNNFELCSLNSNSRHSSKATTLICQHIRNTTHNPRRLFQTPDNYSPRIISFTNITHRNQLESKLTRSNFYSGPPLLTTDCCSCGGLVVVITLLSCDHTHSPQTKTNK